jgi:para-nitrobenzyl esterase
MRALLLLSLLVSIGCGGSMVVPDAGSDPGDAASSPDAGTDAQVLPPPMVTTTSGPVTGSRGAGFLAFTGIPYAAPPVGDLRWRAPQPVTPWTQPRDATSMPPRCAQQGIGFTLPSQEDCLYINVHTPDPRPTNAPVMVWIHGGGFVFGEGLQPDNGTAGDLLASAHGAVVVSFNYRLGPYGFLAHRQLRGADPTSGNFGFADQVAALHWVHDNIAAFGGDPSNVTIFGESAGGLSVCLHLMSSQSAGLFHAAISESGLCDSPLITQNDGENSGQEFATLLGCTGAEAVACMRGKTQAEITAIDPGANAFTELDAPQVWWPHIDGTWVPSNFRDAIGTSTFNRVPTIIGWNRDEGTLFVMLAEQNSMTMATAAEYDTATTNLSLGFGPSVDAIRAQYPIASYPDPGAAIAAALGHAILACPSRRAASLLAAAGIPTRAYHFTYPDAQFQLPASRDLGAFHSAEIQYVFGHPARLGQRRFTGADIPLNEAMSGYWARFAATHDPNGGGAQNWPAYDDGDEVLVLDTTITTTTGPDASACALWDVP